MRQKSTTKIAVQDSGRVIFRLGLVALICYLIFHVDFLAIAASLLLATSLTSRLLAKRSLLGLQLKITTKQLRARSGDPIQATLTLTNHNRFLPVFYPIISVREQNSLRIQVFQHQGIIPAQSSLDLAIAPSIDSRGLRHLEAFAPRSRFPFALHETTASCQSLTPEIVVWPKPAALDVDSLFTDPPNLQFLTQGEQSLPVHSTDPSRIRDYQAGDPKPRINWKLSAKLDKLTVIEPRIEQQERYELFLDTSHDLWPSSFIFERMLGLVSTLVSELSRRHLLQAITVNGNLFPLTNHREFTRFFDTLAILQARATPTDEPLLFRHNQLQILPAHGSSIQLACPTSISR